MQVQLASDQHHELQRHCDVLVAMSLAPEIDNLILAGDTHSGASAVELYGACPVPLVYVHGDRKAYGHRYPESTQFNPELTIAFRRT
jgi:predicted phosphodiesterase